MVQHHRIQPAHTTRTSRYGAILMSTLTDILGSLVEELRGEGALAHTCGVGLSNTHHVVHIARCNARIHGYACCRWARRCHEGVCAVVDAEHNALSTLEQHLLALLDEAVEKYRRVANHGAQPLAKLQVLVVYGIEVARLHAQCRELQVLLCQGILQSLGEVLPIQKVSDADAYAAIFVRICRADTLLRSANLSATLQGLVCAIEHRVVGHDTCRAIRDIELVVGDACAVQTLQLLEERHGVDDHAVGHDVDYMGVEDARRYRLQGEFLAVEDDSMSRVVTTLMAYHNVGTTCIEIRNLTLAFVAPLCAYNNQCLIHNI